MKTRFAVVYTPTGQGWHYAVPGSERALCGILVQTVPGKHRVTTHACSNCRNQVARIVGEKS
jgi:hypothetical protein